MTRRRSRSKASTASTESTAAHSGTGNPSLTLANGEFKFVMLNQEQSTQFRVFTTTNTPVISPVASENVVMVKVNYWIGL